MKYFAYGSNMYSLEIKVTLGSKPKSSGITKLTGYKFAYNKESTRDHSGKANIYPQSDEYVYGVLYEVTAEQMSEIDKKEGGYKRLEISLLLGDKKVKAITYSAKPERINNNIHPTDEYRSKIAKGATENNLPVSYIKSTVCENHDM